MSENETGRSKLLGVTLGESGIMSTGSVILSIGLIITIVSVFADIIGYGTFNEFGVLQTIGAFTGVILIILGIIIKVFKKIWYG